MESACPVCLATRSFERYPDELRGSLPTVDYNFQPATRLTYRIVECLTCHHQWVSPVPPVENLYVENQDEAYLSAREQRSASAEVWLKIVTHHAPPAAGQTLLDVGCATGIFLDAASRHYTVWGVELSDWAANVASTRHKILRRPISQTSLDRKFDVVTMWGVIEHLSDPRRELAAISKILNRNGTIFIYTGDRKALVPRLLRKSWWWYQGMHIQYFSKSGLESLLESLGFEVVETRNLPLFFSLRSLAQSMNRYKSLKPFVWILRKRPFAQFRIRLMISGEMLMIARKVR